MSASEKLILALDVADFELAKNLIKTLGDEVSFYKIGLELMMSGDYFRLISLLKEQNKKVFCDLKLHDISETVAKAVKNLAQHDVDLLTIHISGAETIKRVTENKGKMQVVGVSVLTNLDEKDLAQMGYDQNLSIADLVTKKTALALESGLDGIVCSALEIGDLRKKFCQNFIAVTPGIRLKNDATQIKNDDQKRVADVETALKNGSSYLVVGRPITRAENPLEAAKQFNAEIRKFS
jgi:orotidine-5'-phosphate decarboxylase